MISALYEQSAASTSICLRLNVAAERNFPSTFASVTPLSPENAAKARQTVFRRLARLFKFIAALNNINKLWGSARAFLGLPPDSGSPKSSKRITMRSKPNVTSGTSSSGVLAKIDGAHRRSESANSEACWAWNAKRGRSTQPFIRGLRRLISANQAVGGNCKASRPRLKTGDRPNASQLPRSIKRSHCLMRIMQMT